VLQVSLAIESLVCICWLWSLIIFLIQRSLFSVVFISHEDFTPRKNVHSFVWGSAGGVIPPVGSGGVHPPGWGVQGQVGPLWVLGESIPPDRESGGKWAPCGFRGSPSPRLGSPRASGAPVGVWEGSHRRKNFLVNVYCNFIVNLDRSL
jgi:hypothetical protein